MFFSPRFLRWLWAFFRESLFKNAAFQAWAKNNVRMCLWIGMWLVMLLSILQMAYLLSHTLDENRGLLERTETLESKQKQTLATLQFSIEMTQALSQELNWTRHWMVTHPCPPPTPPETGHSKRKKERNQTLIETLRAWDRDHPYGANAPPPLEPLPKPPPSKKP